MAEMNADATQLSRLHTACLPCIEFMQVGLEQYPQALASILKDSAESMRAECPQESAEQRREWWRARIRLDLRMAELLKHLDEQLLGPWR